jgi:uncharacterized protein involved in response to NO
MIRGIAESVELLVVEILRCWSSSSGGVTSASYSLLFFPILLYFKTRFSTMRVSSAARLFLLFCLCQLVNAQFNFFEQVFGGGQQQHQQQQQQQQQQQHQRGHGTDHWRNQADASESQK